MDRARVLLVTPVNPGTYQSIPDLGLGYLATALRRAGHRVEIVDCVRQGLDQRGLLRAVAREAPDVIGFKAFYTEIASVNESITAIRSRWPEMVAVVGGPHPSCIPPADVIRTFPGADWAFQGEAEVGLPRLLDALPDADPRRLRRVPGLVWRDGGGAVCANEREFPDDLDAAEPAWDLLRPEEVDFGLTFYGHRGRVAPLVATRGCPHRCTFCAATLCAGPRVRTRSVDAVIHEMQHLRDTRDIREFSFVDDYFTGDRAFVQALCEEMLRRDLGARWTCWGVRLPSLDRETVRLMDRAGCRYISVGIESGSPRILRHMRKGLTVDLVRQRLALVREHSDIDVGGMFILGYPEETEADVERTIDLACELPLLLAGFYPFFPVPGTPIYDQLRASGELPAEPDWSTYGAERFAYCPPSMTPRRLRQLYRRAYLRFYTRPRRVAALGAGLRHPSQLRFLSTRFRRRILGSFRAGAHGRA